MQKVKVAAIQMKVSDNLALNLKRAVFKVEQAVKKGAKIIFFP